MLQNCEGGPAIPRDRGGTREKGGGNSAKMVITYTSFQRVRRKKGWFHQEGGGGRPLMGPFGLLKSARRENAIF